MAGQVFRLMDREILFIGGKGGVGKTTLASAVAVMAARAGLRTLLVSTDPAHSTSDMLDVPLGNAPRSVIPNLDALEIDPESETERYIGEVKAGIEDSVAPRLLGEIERQIDVARVSPGAEESALFDRFTRLIRQEEGRYDRIVFDTAPTGHTLRLMSLPEHMSLWIGGLISQRLKTNALKDMWRNVAGSVRGNAGGLAGEAPREDRVLRTLRERQARFAHARDVVTDRARTAFVFVVTPEKLPIAETEKAVAVLERHGVPVGGIVVNRVLPPGLAPHEFLDRRRRRESEYLERIHTRLGARVLFTLPLFDSDIAGLPGLDRVLAALPPDQRAYPADGERRPSPSLR